MTRPTIVLAEDHPDVAEQLRRLLDGAFEVVAVVGHGEALVKAAVRHRPDAVVTDISMPGMDGIKAATELRKLRPAIRVVFVTVHDDPALARKALAIGQAYVLKTTAGDDLVDAVNAALADRTYISAALGPIDTLLAE